MLTITATRGNYLVLSIPNNNVRKQYYEFLLEEYQDNRHINLNDLGLMYYEMAYDGHWRETLEFIAHAYKENSSVRNAIEGERNLQGFFTAYLSTNAYYLIAPEVELNHGYCDLFLMPDLIRYDVKHSYIIELKISLCQRLGSESRSPMERSCRADKRLCCRSQGTQDDIRHRVALHRHAVSRMGVGTDGRSQIETLPDIIILNTQIFISHSVFPVNL